MNGKAESERYAGFIPIEHAFTDLHGQKRSAIVTLIIFSHAFKHIINVNTDGQRYNITICSGIFPISKFQCMSHYYHHFNNCLDVYSIHKLCYQNVATTFCYRKCSTFDYCILLVICSTRNVFTSKITFWEREKRKKIYLVCWNREC